MNQLPIMRLLKSFERSYLHVCEPILEEFRIPQVSFDILMFLNNNPDYCTAKDISEKRNIKPNVISMYVEKLAGEGYISRETYTGDRRKIKLVLTPKALEIVAKGSDVQRKYTEKLYSGISDEELEVFRNCICTLISNTENIAKDKNGGSAR